jgi:hypothetical protein
MASELGGVIGRSRRPVCFILGAGCSLSSGAPPTATVHQAFAAATSVRFGGIDLRDALHTMPEQEKQDILAPLFADVKPGPGYSALAALARHRSLLVINLNWDMALALACERSGVQCDMRDIRDLLKDPPSASDTGVIDVHVHGIIGRECRYGRLETLVFSDQEAMWMLEHGLANTSVIIGAALAFETDFTELFARWARSSDGQRPTASQWFFMRGQPEDSAEDRLRRSNVHAQPFTYVREPDVDFDMVATLLVDRALGMIPGASGKGGR